MKLTKVGVGFLAVLCLGGWTLAKWHELFPKTPATAEFVRPDPIDRATQMHEAGATENAILLLERIPLKDPSYQQAQMLIGHYEQLLGTRPRRPLLPPLLVRAEQGHCLAVLVGIQGIREQCDEDCQSLLRPCRETLARRVQELTLFGERRYSRLLPSLWIQFHENPMDHDTRFMLTVAYCDLAIAAMMQNRIELARKRVDLAQSAGTALDAGALDSLLELLSRIEAHPESFQDPFWHQDLRAARTLQPSIEFLSDAGLLWDSSLQPLGSSADTGP